jgi:hypothetical protein
MSVKTARQTFLSKKCGTHNFSVRTGLVLHEMVGIVGDRQTGVVTDLAKRHVCRTHKAIGKPALTCRNRNTGRILGGTTQENCRMISALVESELDLRTWDSVSVGNRRGRGRGRGRHFELMSCFLWY